MLGTMVAPLLMTIAADPVYIGTYTRGDSASEGIYVVDLTDGRLGEPRLAAAVEQPSFVAIAPGGRHLYAVTEVSDFGGESGGKRSGGVVAFRIESDHTLTELSRQPTGGGGACHLSLTPDGRTLLVANYGGSVASLPIAEDGSVQPAASMIAHEGGSGVVARRQNAPHAHAIHPSPDGRFAFAPDLGLDAIKAYRLEGSTLVPDPERDVALSPGGGPRHFAWHPDGGHAFCNLELSSELTMLAYDAQTGTLSPLMTLSTLPDDWDGGGGTAETLVSPDGRFVYVTNRGHDSIATFAIGDGTIERIALTPSGGQIPRGMGLSPDGRHLIIGNQQSAAVVAYSIGEDGIPQPTGSVVSIDRPVNARFLPPR